MPYFHGSKDIIIKDSKFVDITIQGADSKAVNQVIDKLGKLATKSTTHEQAIDKLAELVLTAAQLDEGARIGLPTCHGNTRKQVREEVDNWSLDMNAKPILWLNGPVGIGKSTVLRTLSEKWFGTNNRPGACFSFSHPAHYDKEQKNFVPTLAYQLARRISSFRQSIIETIDEHPALLGQVALGTQFEHLITKPLMAARSVSPNLQVVIVIDGLVESCFDPGGRSEKRVEHPILHAIAYAYKVEPKLPARFLIASRREVRIDQYFKHEDLHELLHEVRLDNHSPSVDIKCFLADMLRKIQKTHPCAIDASWPPEEKILLLVYKSSGQFLYSSTAVQFIGKVESDPRHQLESICGTNPQATPEQPFLDIDLLYIRILNCIKETSRGIVAWILGPLCFKWGRLTGSYGRIFKRALCVQSPRFLEKLFLMEEGGLRGHLIDLGSVLDIPEGDRYSTAPIRPFHASFFEFLTNSQRSGELCVCKKQAHIIRQVILMKHIFIFLSMPKTASPYDERAVISLFTKGIRKMYLEDGTCNKEIFTADPELQSGLEALMSSTDGKYLAYLKNMEVKQEHSTSWRCTFKELISPTEEGCMCRYIKDCALYDTSASWVPRTWRLVKWGSRAIFLESAGSHTTS